MEKRVQIVGIPALQGEEEERKKFVLSAVACQEHQGTTRQDGAKGRETGIETERKLEEGRN